MLHWFSLTALTASTSGQSRYTKRGRHQGAVLHGSVPVACSPCLIRLWIYGGPFACFGCVWSPFFFCWSILAQFSQSLKRNVHNPLKKVVDFFKSSDPKWGKHVGHEHTTNSTYWKRVNMWLKVKRTVRMNSDINYLHNSCRSGEPNVASSKRRRVAMCRDGLKTVDRLDDYTYVCRLDSWCCFILCQI